MSEKNNNAQVLGILKYNNSIREEMLNRGYWEDVQYTKYASGIGSYHNIRTNDITSSTKNEGLYNFTHNGNSDFIKEINRKYFQNKEKKAYEIEPLGYDLTKWKGDYLSQFNDNNVLGEIGDAKYLQALTFNNYANTDRDLRNKYLTPSLLSFYGSNPKILRSPYTGRIPEILEAKSVRIIHSIDDNSIDKSVYYEKLINNKYGLVVSEGDNPTINFEPYYDTEHNNFTASTENYNYDVKELNTEEIPCKNLLQKTQNLFKSHKIKTMNGEFYDSNVLNKNDFDSAFNSIYGYTHGRSLLSKKIKYNDNSSGYDNPYSRVWTNRSEYSKYKNLIRPFVDKTMDDVQKMNYNFRALSGNSISNGGLYLKENTVLNESGYVNIAPSKVGNVDIKKCMFSIENLAWKDVIKKEEYLTSEQIGPNGGRIMWFPPYDLDFQETTNIDWESNSFIGRGEKVYTYKDTDRSGTLSFMLLIDHPAVINGINESVEDIDVLRFFAGEQLLDIEKTEGIQIENNQQRNLNDDKKQGISEENTESIRFYVYFPNNYSGNQQYISENDWYQKGYSDKDWYYYLLLGNGIDVNLKDKNTWVGYEMSDSGLGESKKQIGTYLKKDGCEAQWNINEINGDGKYNYRPDFDLNQTLSNPDNYIDNQSSHLNSKIIENEYVKNNANYSFSEIMVALLKINDTKDISIDELEEHVIKLGASKNRIDELVNIFNSDPTYLKMDITGLATNQNNKITKGCPRSNADLLAERRGSAVKYMLKNLLFKNNDIQDIIYLDIDDKQLKQPKEINTSESKFRRGVYVEIKYNSPKISNLNDGGIITKEVVKEQSEKVKVRVDNSISNTSIRYENEAEYFAKLGREDSFIFKRIKDKFKYFTPAFHSISPEGFNARLTFLQQCTRQGKTVEAKTATNLSFGRMPVCVLRIGDFINTKIIIKNLSINYNNSGGVQWDLNPEGIGVQPMFAKITMGITIIGGQSLDGPINRLQNAVTFDYYANTGVYDNRADRVLYVNSNIEPSYDYLWSPDLQINSPRKPTSSDVG